MTDTTGEKWTDESFSGLDMFVYEFVDPESLVQIKYLLKVGELKVLSWPDIYPDADIFDSEDGHPDWREPIQGDAGTCYIMAALSAVSEFPELIEDMFITK